MVDRPGEPVIEVGPDPGGHACLLQHVEHGQAPLHIIQQCPFAVQDRVEGGRLAQADDHPVGPVGHGMSGGQPGAQRLFVVGQADEHERRRVIGKGNRCRPVLDIYHASEHLHEAAVARDGAPATAWYERHRRTLLESGAAGLLADLAAEPGDVSELISYLEPHLGHTAYRERLAEGRSIGSGMVEGACKTAIGKRLKQTGAWWKVRRLERMAALCCLQYGDQLDAYWKKAAG